MKSKSKLVIVLLNVMTLMLLLSISALAHPGRTDANGGHTDHSTGEYHYHHGYPAHDHYDMDGDGIIDCPYNFVDKTNHDSSSNSGITGKSNNTQSNNYHVTQSSKGNEDSSIIEDIVICALIDLFFGFVIILLLQIPMSLSRKILDEKIVNTDFESVWIVFCFIALPLLLFTRILASPGWLFVVFIIISIIDVVSDEQEYGLIIDIISSFVFVITTYYLFKNDHHSDILILISTYYCTAIVFSVLYSFKKNRISDSRPATSKGKVSPTPRQLPTQGNNIQADDSIKINYRDDDRELLSNSNQKAPQRSRIPIEKISVTIPENCYVGEDGLPATTIGQNKKYIWGEGYTVFVADNSGVYHNYHKCSIEPIHPMNIHKALSKGLTPCSICVKKQLKISWFYRYEFERRIINNRRYQ